VPQVSNAFHGEADYTIKHTLRSTSLAEPAQKTSPEITLKITLFAASPPPLCKLVRRAHLESSHEDLKRFKMG
jgi:hypothetical protein